MDLRWLRSDTYNRYRLFFPESALKEADYRRDGVGPFVDRLDVLSPTELDLRIWRRVSSHHCVTKRCCFTVQRTASRRLRARRGSPKSAESSARTRVHLTVRSGVLN